MHTVTLEYLIKNQNDFVKQEILFENYFDLEKNEEVDINSVPKYSQPFQYLSVNLNNLVFVKLNLEIGNAKRIFNQTFWNDGDNFLTERIDIGEKNYREIILSVKIPEKNDTYETLRLYFGSNFIVPVYHSLIRTDYNQEEVEQRFDTNLFIEMIKQDKV